MPQLGRKHEVIRMSFGYDEPENRKFEKGRQAAAGQGSSSAPDSSESRRPPGRAGFAGSQRPPGKADGAINQSVPGNPGHVGVQRISGTSGYAGARKTAGTSEYAGTQRAASEYATVRRTSASQRTASIQTISGGNPSGSHRSRIEQLRREQAKKDKRKKRIIAMIVAECLALTFIFGYAYFARRLSLMPRPDVDEQVVQNEELEIADLQKMEGYWMIAVFGVDSRNGSVGAGNQSDVNLIACVNQDSGEIKLVSVYRDSYLNTGENRFGKFNEAYARGGPEQALKYLNKNLDLNITSYITFSWKAVADSINILGGVDLEISKAEFRYINSFITETVKSTNIGSHQLKSAGMNHLDGVQAVAYGRLRLMDNDYARTERQRKIIELAFAKAKQADYATLNNILVTVLPQVSHNLDFTELTNMALRISKYHIGETGGFPFAIGEANIPGKGSCVIPRTLESNVSQLHTFLFGDENYVPTETVKQLSERIAADSGMYTQGKNMGKVSTEGVLPKETTAAPATTEEPETTKAVETDENGTPVIEPSENETSTEYPSIGETDEFGNLIDGPETEEPDSPQGPLQPSTNSRPLAPGESWFEPNGPGVFPGESQQPPYPGYEPESSSEGTQNYGPNGPGSVSSPAEWGPGVTTMAQEAAMPGGNTQPQNAGPGGDPSLGPGETLPVDPENLGGPGV